MTSDSTQLTKYPPGSVKEMWGISWPLMLSLLSGCMMHFVDRLFLGNYSINSLTAATVAWLAAYVLLMAPMRTASISKVYVGKMHGANQLDKLSQPVWQMLWFSLALLPLFWLAAAVLPSIFFRGSPNELLQEIYFKILIRGGSWFCFVTALSGFFTGQGKTKFVGLTTLLANAINILLDLVLIFGWGPIESMGIKGAAMATVSAQAFQAILLGLFFVRTSLRNGKLDWKLDIGAAWGYIKTGLPAGIAYTSEILAHFTFFKIMERGDPIYLVIVTFINSLYLLMTFVIEGLCKSVMAVSANLIGAKKWSLLPSNLKSSFKLHFFFFAALFVTVLVGGPNLFRLFVSKADTALFENSRFVTLLRATTLGISLYFLIDGFNWITIGSLIAAEDTKFIMVTALFAQWGAYVLPVFLAVNIFNVAIPIAWLMILTSTAALLPVLLLRFRHLDVRRRLLVE